MAAGCCGGVKKQKLTTTSSSPERSSGLGGSNGLKKSRVVTHEMVVFCFDVLHGYLQSDELPKPPKFTNDKYPLFVTWKIGKERKLRGCIGTFNITSLHQGLREYAITSACKDSRFSPISTDEISRLHCSVSLLTDFEPACSYVDWEVGIHGIRIEFTNEKGSRKAATYLPEVAVEQGWNQVQTIDSLLRKGGFKGSITQEIRCSVSLTRFQSDNLSLSYAEYLTHKSAVSLENNCGTNGVVPVNGCGTVASLIHQNGLLNGFHQLMTSSSRGENHLDNTGHSSGQREISASSEPSDSLMARNGHIVFNASPAISSAHVHHRYPTREQARHNFPAAGGGAQTTRYLPRSPNHPYCPPKN